MNKLGIDVETRHKAHLIRTLKRLKTTEAVEDGGAYWYDRHYSQVHLTTTWTESELDDWPKLQEMAAKLA